MSASAHQQKHEEERPCWPAFHFHSVSLICVNLWPISTLCVADMVHAVADVDCGRYRLWPMWFVADIVVSRMERVPPKMLTMKGHRHTTFVSIVI